VRQDEYRSAMIADHTTIDWGRVSQASWGAANGAADRGL